MLLQDRHDFQAQERDRYPMLLQDRHDFQVHESGNDAQFGDDGFMFKECQPHGESFHNDNRTIEDERFAIYNKAEYENKVVQQQLHVHEPINVDYHEVTSVSPAPYQNSDFRKKGVVCFLAWLCLVRYIKRKNTSPSTADINRHTSINKVVDMLHRNHNHGVNSIGKSIVKHSVAAANLRDKKQATRKDDPAMISEEMNLKSTSFSKENSSQKFGEVTFVDFKRRSTVRKNLEDDKTGNHCETQNEKSAAAAQRKERKLIRPDFCESESSERGISGYGPQLAIFPSTEYSVSKNTENIRTADKGNYCDNGSDTNSEKISAENFIDSRSADGGKESSEHNCISSMTSISCRNRHVEVEQDMTTRDTRMEIVLRSN
ncbi:uncharacterized protein LOC120210330 isoform X1 [Hibiscus syriacus]|nr:uncharacterized protein LOC120210330 isoform X1 [Hibiscus syriacus]